MFGFRENSQNITHTCQNTKWKEKKQTFRHFCVKKFTKIYFCFVHHKENRINIFQINFLSFAKLRPPNVTIQSLALRFARPEMYFVSTWIHPICNQKLSSYYLAIIWTNIRHSLVNDSVVQTCIHCLLEKKSNSRRTIVNVILNIILKVI